MKIFWAILFLLPLFVRGQEKNAHSPSANRSLKNHIYDYSVVDGVKDQVHDISGFINKLEQKQTEKSTLKFCRTLFHKTRQEFFRRYSQQATFSEMLDKGKYNCLTGTALYALLLDHFDISFTVIETNYHIFLLVSTNEGKVLFEATDPMHGFVDNPVDIEKRIEQYKRNAIQATGDEKKYYQYNFNLYKKVNLSEIKGLLHCNFSIEAYNNQNFQLAVHHLEMATELYSSARIHEFSTVLLLAVMESNLETNIKQAYIQSIQRIRKRQLQVMASRM